jgi:hypothetical protein
MIKKMYDNEVTFKFNPNEISLEDIPKLKVFITYLNSLIELYEKEEQEQEVQLSVKKKLTSKRKTKKIPSKKEAIQIPTLEFIEEEE